MQHNENCNIFADDNAIYSFGYNVDELQNKLQSAVHQAGAWYKSNTLQVNVPQSAIMLLSSCRNVNEIDVSMDTIAELII